MICADCGARVEPRYGKWAARVEPGFRYCCRYVLNDEHRLVSADYHYIDGERQRHFPDPEANGG